ncbi:blue copper protein-like [Coffea eugenioides]|uniref:Blue copper protein n=1 Tax=Coffea arabica TaxID=13443 RepID=A0A6P6UU20_COFAR|nr:blue copper protein-like [Coffea arabica]XP_027148400.1 blue copper protein-like [Coffea eugenioides]
MAKQSSGILCLILIAFAAVPSWATDYTVGDTSGWALGIDYTSWTGGKTFKVGDNLVFNYATSHTVDEVTQSDYGTCAVGNAISTDNTGATTIPLKTPGTHYFICGVVGHCGGGMKLSVTVTGGGPTASPPAGSGTTTSPSSGTTTTPATATTTLTPPSSTTTTTQPSSSAALTPFGALFFTLVALISKLVMS